MSKWTRPKDALPRHGRKVVVLCPKAAVGMSSRNERTAYDVLNLVEVLCRYDECEGFEVIGDDMLRDSDVVYWRPYRGRRIVYL